MSDRDGDNVSSLMWGGATYPVTEAFADHPGGNYDAMYAYSADYGLKAGDHAGVDIGMPLGTRLYAPEDGVILHAGESDFFRPYPVWEKTTDGRVIILGHMEQDAVKTGDTVHKGDYLGLSGQETVKGDPNTPDGTGPHLHLEERVPLANADGAGIVGYKVVDPLNLILGTGYVPDATSGASGGGGMLSLVSLPGIFGKWGPIGTVLVAGGMVVATVATLHLAGNLLGG